MKAVVFDDEKTILNIIKKVLQKEEIQVLTYSQGKNAIKIISNEKPDIVFLDISLKDANGLDILKQIVNLKEKPYIVMISGHDEYNYLIEAMKLGAYDFIPKPFDISDIRRIAKEIKQSLSLKYIESDDIYTEIVGKSPAMKEVFKLIGRASITDEPVLITGESGTGKEVVANLIHKHSNRGKMPFVAINCAAIPSELVESELFGYEKGAFTGAEKRKTGKIQSADGGTLFLDEISELPIDAQGKLLRFLQEKEITPVGSTRNIKVDVKIITATNKDLKQLVKQGKFREDLYYRLSVIEIFLPSLRERKDDIPELIKLFTKQALKKHNLQKGGFTEEAIELLVNYDFPGNVRELKNLVFKLIALYRERPITIDLLPENILNKTSTNINWEDLVKSEVKKLLKLEHHNIYDKIISKVEEIIITEGLKHTNGNISKTAKFLGIHRNTIHNKIEELNIKVEK